MENEGDLRQKTKVLMQLKSNIKILINLKDFPGGPVVKTPCSQCRGPGFDPWSGN